MSSEPVVPQIERSQPESVAAVRVAETTVQPIPSNAYLRLFKSNVFVRDLDRAMKFYVDQLGFSVLAEARFEFSRWVAVAPPDGNAILAVVVPKRGSENYKFIGRPTQVGFIAEDIYATYDLWRSRGVRFLHPPQPHLWGGTLAVFCDVDGNSFDLLGSDEMSREIEAQRRAQAERAEAERRAAQELEIAKQVQARLFPQTFPGLRTLDYAGACIQARHVGGDYYDFFALGEERLGLFVGDISGKGIAAALLMANLQANLRSQFALAREQPQRFLQSVNRLFFENTVDSAYATVFFAEYDDASRRLRYTNCGHLSALLLRRNGRAEWLHSTGTVLGLFQGLGEPDGGMPALPRRHTRALHRWSDRIVQRGRRGVRRATSGRSGEAALRAERRRRSLRR